MRYREHTGGDSRRRFACFGTIGRTCCRERGIVVMSEGGLCRLFFGP